MRRAKASPNFDLKLSKKGKSIPVLSNLEVDNSVNYPSIKLRGNWKWRPITRLYSDIRGSYRPYAFSKLWLPVPLFTWVLQPDYNFTLLGLYQ